MFSRLLSFSSGSPAAFASFITPSSACVSRRWATAYGADQYFEPVQILCHLPSAGGHRAGSGASADLFQSALDRSNGIGASADTWFSSGHASTSGPKFRGPPLLQQLAR